MTRERRPPQRRRVSDVLKPKCPWCGGSTSAVYRSRQYRPEDEFYRRRRQCGECGKDFPTKELLDLELFEKELAKAGLTLADLDLA